ncbi:MAG: hypothetical protein ACJAZ8_001163, partial [Planctomycetota bacterium]
MLGSGVALRAVGALGARRLSQQQGSGTRTDLEVWDKLSV